MESIVQELRILQELREMNSLVIIKKFFKSFSLIKFIRLELRLIIMLQLLFIKMLSVKTSLK